MELVDKWLLLTPLILMFIENGSCGGFNCFKVATTFSDAGYSVNISTNTEIGSKVYNLSFSADPSETVELQLQGISNYFELKEDGSHSWSLETKTCLTLNDEENVEFAGTINGGICDPQVVQMKVQATIPSMPDTPNVIVIDTGCKLGRILKVFKIQPNNANTGSCGVTFNCTVKPDNSNKTFWIENVGWDRSSFVCCLVHRDSNDDLPLIQIPSGVVWQSGDLHLSQQPKQGTWLYTDADCMDGDHEYIARVTCIETGASEEYSIDMPVYLTISRGDTGYESSDDSTMTTSTTASTKGVSVSSAPPQNANIIGIWPVYVTLSFLIGVATGCFGYYLLKNKCKKKEQQTSVKAKDETL